MKITKDKDFRFNFEMDGLHYSFNEDDTEEYYVGFSFRCKETNASIFISHSLYKVLQLFQKRKWHHGITYNEFYDLTLMETLIKELLFVGNYKNSELYKRMQI